MTDKHERSLGLRLAGAAAMAALLAGGAFLWWHGRDPVPVAGIEGFLDRSWGAGWIRFSVGRVVTLHRDGAGIQVAVDATARVMEPLYQEIDTSDYLLRTFKAEAGSTSDARRLLGSESSVGGSGAPAATPLPADPYRSSVLQLSSPAGAVFNFQGIIDSRGDGGSNLSMVSGRFVGPAPRGYPRSTFKGPTFLAGDPQDDARLRGQLADLQAFAARAGASPELPGSQRAGTGEASQRTFLSQVTPGRIFRGLAVEEGLEQGTTLYLEIVSVSDAGEVRALLRNDCGWQSARTFEGAWSPGAASGGPDLNLSSRADQAVRGGGPFLEEAQTRSFALRWEGARGLTGESRRYRVQFQAVDPKGAGELVARLRREFAGALGATAPGMLYIGTATSRASGAPEAILLRFVARAQGGESLDARIESTSNSWKRPLRGSIVANARRSGGEPIRLQLSQDGAVGDAPAGSILGCAQDLEIRLGVDGESMAGEDGQFSYRFKVASDADLRRLEAERQARSARLTGIFRQGIVFDGSLREEQGFISRARLEIDKFDRETGKLHARIVSLSRLNVYREFTGVLDPSGSAVVLSATARGGFRTDGEFEVPFLKTATAATLRMSLAEGSIAGRIEGDPAWTLDFPTRAFAAARVEPADGESAAAAYPPLPKGAGAYLLSGGSWQALPTNQGHEVTETVRPETDAHLSLNLLEDVSQGIGLIEREKDKQKVRYFEFPGKDPAPSNAGSTATLLFVGAAGSASPPVELVPCELMKDGRRRVLIAGGAPGTIRFGEARVAAYVRQVAPGAVMLTTTSALEPGPYVFNADTGYELTSE